MRKIALIAAAAVVLLLCFLAFNFWVPFGLEDVKRVKAHELTNNVREWLMQSKREAYGYTNETDACSLCRTNLAIGGSTVQIVMRLDSLLFRKQGFLLATESMGVFWVSHDGRIQRIEAK